MVAGATSIVQFGDMLVEGVNLLCILGLVFSRACFLAHGSCTCFRCSVGIMAATVEAAMFTFESNSLR